MAFVFPVRSTTSRSKPGRSMSSTHSRSPTSASLPVISEDEDSTLEIQPPPIPARASNRPTRTQVFGEPPRHNHEKSPPPYSNFNTTGVIGPNGEKLADLRNGITRDIKNNKFVAKRGGWMRLAIIALILMCMIVGLVVGLVVGLNKKHNTKNSNPNNTNDEGGASGIIPKPRVTPNATFPEGSYRFETFLSTISTNCTSNPATWMCYPYSTYAQNPASSATTFDWVISSTSNSNYTISSTLNYFAILFSNASLTLRNNGQADEHYFFQTTMQKPTKPTTQLGNRNVASTCYFNQTIFQGYLYTRMNATYGSSSSNSTSATDSSAYTPWPYAVRVEQMSAAGADTPTCVGPDGQSLGDFSVNDTSRECVCQYLNTGT